VKVRRESFSFFSSAAANEVVNNPRLPEHVADFVGTLLRLVQITPSDKGVDNVISKRDPIGVGRQRALYFRAVLA
jgi:hypothetical protein